MAREAGLVHVKRVECAGGFWEVEGRTQAGREIGPRTGRIAKVEHD